MDLKQWHENYKKEIYEKQYVILPDKTEKHVTEFNDKSVTMDEFSELRMNSYAKDKFIGKLNDETLLSEIKYYQNQCGRYNYPAVTYNDTLIHVIIPELIKRWQNEKEFLNYFNNHNDIQEFWFENSDREQHKREDLVKFAQEDIQILLNENTKLEEENSLLSNEVYLLKEKLGLNDDPDSPFE